MRNHAEHFIACAQRLSRKFEGVLLVSIGARDLSRELRCMVCQNQSLADSDAPLARDLRRELYELMQSGRSDGEIKTYLTERYGDFVLYRPPLDRRTWWLWFGPGVLAVIGLVAVVLIVRRRRRPADAAALRPLEEETW